MTVIAKSKRLPRPVPLVAIGWANTLFVLIFLLALFAATHRARAQEDQSCGATDLSAQLRAENPAAFAAVEQEADAVLNGDALLWKIEKPGVEPSHLLGTIHLSDPRVVALPPAVQSALDGASTVVIETTEVMDRTKFMAALAARPDLMMFTDETTMTSLLSEDERELVEAELNKRGVSLASMNKMKPWMIAMALASPPCEAARQAKGQPVLDQKIALEAQAKGKELKGLETLIDQFGALASLSMETHVAGLVQAVTLGDRAYDVTETMIALYLENRINMFEPLIKRTMPAMLEGYPEFEQVMLTKRNHTMAERAAPILDEGDAFIAVGALHLPGPEGLVALLRERGYTLSPVQ